MSIVVSALHQDWVVIAYDGRLSRRQPDGSLFPVGEFNQKMHPVNDELAVGITGSQKMENRLSQELRNMAAEFRGDPALFSMIAQAIPQLARKIISDLLSEGITIEGCAIHFTGWDSSTRKMRAVTFISTENFSVIEASFGEIGAIGNAGATALVPQVLDRKMGELGRCPEFWEVSRFAGEAIRESAEKLPHTINGNVWTYVITAPYLRAERAARKLDRLLEPEALQVAEADGLTFGRTLQTALTTGAVDPSKAGVLAKGSTPTTLNSGFSYTSTSSSIDLVWDALTLYRADRTSVLIGTGSQNVTGLSASTAYFAFPFYDEATSTFGFVSNSEVLFPTITGIAYASASTQYATTTTSAALPAAFSISYWTKVAPGYVGSGGINKNTSHTTTPISSVNSSFTTGWASGKITVFYRDSGGTTHPLTSVQTYNDGEFHNVTYVCNPASSSQVLYVDGVSVATGAVATAVSATAGFFWVGKDSGNVNVSGTLTEIAFFNVALTATNALAIYNAGNSVSQTALEAVITSLAPTIWWKSTDAGPTTVADSGSISGNTGSAVNSPTFATSAAVFGAVGSPAILWPSRAILVTQEQNAQGHVPFTAGGFACSTVASGTGGGSNSGSSGGSGSGCYSGNTQIQTPYGSVAISELRVGDFVISHGGISRKVLAVLRHEKAIRSMVDIGGEFVTPNHIVANGDEWTSAGELFKRNPRVQFDGEVFNLTIEGHSFDEHSFLLASGLLSHNAKLL